jgi:hypothetical protein
VQSLPFIAAVGLALIERSRFNDLAYWRALQTPLGGLLVRRPARAPAATPIAEREIVQ